ncbi:hypothetical protein [Paenarthrobacter ureafaciens]|uniref:hypothetical protein n=1 Tax=Paenarthrobacter ureafaciens TaxID=37931 RepID=UPI00140B1D41|nr:hypothetical protein [Paenarthrobacter ureafaciens]MCX8456113.1 hypothetical protein [Paenarthrobacter ureafaciens]MCY0973662.1 hypothetical protein [Paenarthrobacter ureafaciens]QQQ62760.1 hypothetical protein JHQ56_02565 [Paenarthrobacter ureafaciens]
MLQNALREGALSELDGGYELRIGLPWIRSMPLSSISALSVQLDGEPVGNRLRIRLGDRDVQAEALPVEAGWWFIQDRLVLVLPREAHAVNQGGHAGSSVHRVSVHFELMVPYLQGPDGGPLVLPFKLEAKLQAAYKASGGVSRDVA